MHEILNYSAMQTRRYILQRSGLGGGMFQESRSHAPVSTLSGRWLFPTYFEPKYLVCRPIAGGKNR